jgi:6-phosphogluconolactonase/glucosamine-6-phosphate isomerase/deaminase
LTLSGGEEQMSSEMAASVMLSGGKAPFRCIESLSAETKGTMSIKVL